MRSLNTWALGIALLSASFFACKEVDETNQYTLQFRPSYDGASIELQKPYPYESYEVKFSKFTLFISDLTLVREDDTEVLLSDVQFLDFSRGTSAVMKPIAFNFEVPRGKYKSLKFGYGVSPLLNAKGPSTYPANHPLNLAYGEFWDSWKSYIFMKIEGYAVENGNPDIGLVYHCGSDAAYRNQTRSIVIDLSEADVTTKFAIDLKNLFIVNGEAYDIRSDNTTSDNPNNVKVATDIMDRLDQAVIIE
jgi:hypothetical protein